MHGVARMADMMLTGRSYGAEDGVGIGFSQYLTEDGEGLAKGLSLAEAMARNAPLTTASTMKRRYPKSSKTSSPAPTSCC